MAEINLTYHQERALALFEILKQDVIELKLLIDGDPDVPDAERENRDSQLLQLGALVATLDKRIQSF